MLAQHTHAHARHTTLTRRARTSHAHTARTGGGGFPPLPLRVAHGFWGRVGGQGLETSRESLLPPYSPYPPPPEGAREFLLTPRPQGQKEEGKRTTRARLPSPHCLSSASPPPPPDTTPIFNTGTQTSPMATRYGRTQTSPPPQKSKRTQAGAPALVLAPPPATPVLLDGWVQTLPPRPKTVCSASSQTESSTPFPPVPRSLSSPPLDPPP